MDKLKRWVERIGKFVMEIRFKAAMGIMPEKRVRLRDDQGQFCDRPASIYYVGADKE